MFDYNKASPPILALIDWQYDLITPPAVRPIDIVDLRSHIRIDWINDNQESYLKTLIDTAVNYAENYMGRALMTQTWRTYRDDFSTEPYIELQKNPLQSLTLFKYYDNNGVLQDLLPQLNTLYYITNDPNGYSQIIPLVNQSFPNEDQLQQRQQCVIVEFKIGYGLEKSNVPAPIRTALMNHVAFLYANRGDSDVAGGKDSGGGDISNSSLQSLPNLCKDVYNQFRIRNLATNVTIKQFNTTW